MINLLKLIFVLNAIQNNFANILHTIFLRLGRKLKEDVSNVKFDITIVPFEISPTY